MIVESVFNILFLDVDTSLELAIIVRVAFLLSELAKSVWGVSAIGDNNFFVACHAMIRDKESSTVGDMVAEDSNISELVWGS